MIYNSITILLLSCKLLKPFNSLTEFHEMRSTRSLLVVSFTIVIYCIDLFIGLQLSREK